MEATANAGSSEEMRPELSDGSGIAGQAKKQSRGQKVVNSLHGVVVPKVSQ